MPFWKRSLCGFLKIQLEGLTDVIQSDAFSLSLGDQVDFQASRDEVVLVLLDRDGEFHG